jgi:transposase
VVTGSPDRALHTVVLSRMTHHAPTRAWVARRTAEGKTPREIKRCLKRYLARRLFKLLEASPGHVQREKIATT